jgi:hypothetical protein
MNTLPRARKASPHSAWVGGYFFDLAPPCGAAFSVLDQESRT